MEDIEAVKARMLKRMMDRGRAESRAPVVLTDATFQSELSKYPAMVVDCWAEWCHPCRILSPVVDELAKEYAGRIAFGKLNVDENPRTAQAYQVMSIPTLLVFREGVYRSRVVGVKPKQALKAEIEGSA
ncbi:MAG: thioredoxin [Nitrososphaerota archaeon]|nr:thioredoxin [Nitrososphaerota archaeon]MDG6938791.1 thioredoxin [Nitrososphaerota archaeon]